MLQDNSTITATEALLKRLQSLETSYHNLQEQVAQVAYSEKSQEEQEAIKTKLEQAIAQNTLLEHKLRETQQQLQSASNAFVGSITPFATPTPPEGWLECNGQVVSREIYNKLFGTIGTNWGAGDRETTFQLPDMRGQFVRGWDKEGNIDPDRVFGSLQSDQIQTHKHNDEGHFHGIDSHSHSFTTNSAGSHGHVTHVPHGSDRDGGSQGWVCPGGTHRAFKTSDRGGAIAVDFLNAAGEHIHSGGTSNATPRIHSNRANITEPTGATHGAETRPKNIALLYCIKY